MADPQIYDPKPPRRYLWKRLWGWMVSPSSYIWDPAEKRYRAPKHGSGF